MRRSDRARDRDFSLALIDRCTHGVMALSTGEAVPYCLPLSLVRVGEDLYFHCARTGRKTDLLRRFPQVCVTFVGEDRPAFVAPVRPCHRHSQRSDRPRREGPGPAGPVPKGNARPHGGLRGRCGTEPERYRRVEGPHGGTLRQGQAGTLNTHHMQNKGGGY